MTQAQIEATMFEHGETVELAKRVITSVDGKANKMWPEGIPVVYQHFNKKSCTHYCLFPDGEKYYLWLGDLRKAHKKDSEDK